MRAIVVFLLLISASAAGATDVKWSTLPFGKSCKELKAGDPDKGEDYILKACDSAPEATTFILYNEGTRMSVGFGSKPHAALRYVETERKGNPPIQWGSVDGSKADVAIARFRPLGSEKDSLFVFRLLPDGMSCVVGEVGAVKNQNEAAQKLAVAALKDWKCLGEPELLQP